jgi:hypothetical protein
MLSNLLAGYYAPTDFNEDAFKLLSQRVISLRHLGAWTSFHVGLNGTVFRFAAADEARDRWFGSLEAPDAFGNSRARHAQEASFYAFFSCARASIECFFFSMYALGACLKPNEYPLESRDDFRGVSLTSTLRLFETHYPNDSLTKTMGDVCRSTEMQLLGEYRDTLTHRGALPRTHTHVARRVDGNVTVKAFVKPDLVGVAVPQNPKSNPRDWMPTMSLEQGALDDLRRWLGATVGDLLREGADFAGRHAPPA